MSDFALECPFCHTECENVRCERYADMPREVHVSAFHRLPKIKTCEGYMRPSWAAAALHRKAREKFGEPRAERAPKAVSGGS